MVVSVGPYRFHTEALQARSPLASGGGSASPPQRRRSVVEDIPASRSICQLLGVACMSEAWLRVSRRKSAWPSRASAEEARETQPPESKGWYSSSPAMSKESEVTAK